MFHFYFFIPLQHTTWHFGMCVSLFANFLTDSSCTQLLLESKSFYDLLGMKMHIYILHYEMMRFIFNLYKYANFIFWVGWSFYWKNFNLVIYKSEITEQRNASLKNWTVHHNLCLIDYYLVQMPKEQNTNRNGKYPAGVWQK